MNGRNTVCLSFTDLCGNMVKIGSIFLEGVNESDPDSTKRIASAYGQIMTSCSEEPLETAVTASISSHLQTTRINDEILALLNQKLEEMKPLLVPLYFPNHR